MAVRRPGGAARAEGAGVPRMTEPARPRWLGGKQGGPHLDQHRRRTPRVVGLRQCVLPGRGQRQFLVFLGAREPSGRVFEDLFDETATSSVLCTQNGPMGADRGRARPAEEGAKARPAKERSGYWLVADGYDLDGQLPARGVVSHGGAGPLAHERLSERRAG
jgi:hypothetical protein